MKQLQGISIHNTSATLSTGLLQSNLKTSIEVQKRVSEVRRWWLSVVEAKGVFYIIDIITYGFGFLSEDAVGSIIMQIM